MSRPRRTGSSTRRGRRCRRLPQDRGTASKRSSKRRGNSSRACRWRAASRGIRVRSYFGETRQPALNRQLNEILDAREATALIVHNDAVVASLPPVLSSRGIAVPGDLSVVGMFSEDFGRMFSLPYTAVETSPDTLGRLAVQALIRRMQTPEDAGVPKVELIAPAITDRGSTRSLIQACLPGHIPSLGGRARRG